MYQIKPLQNKGPNKFGVPDKKAVFFPYKRTAFLSGTPNFFGPSYFEAALVGQVIVCSSQAWEEIC